MKLSNTDNIKSRGRPITTGIGLLVAQRWHEPDLKKIDAWAKANGTTRSEAVRRLVGLGLANRAKKS